MLSSSGVTFVCESTAAPARQCNNFLEFGREAGGAMDDRIGHSSTYRVAVGPRAGQNVFALQTVSAREAGPGPGVAQYARFSLHAGLGVEANQRAKLERLARSVS